MVSFEDAMQVEAPAIISHSPDRMTTNLLIIDDDQELTGLLGELLAQEGFQLDAHASGAGAAARAVSGDYALIILDVMLPDVNGFEVLRQIRQTSKVPVILLTARGADVDRIVGLEIGADDYVPKPFNARELTARIRAVLRRLEPRPDEPDRVVLSVDDVSLNPGSRAVLRHGAAVDVTTVEFDILRLLLESAGKTVARERISEQVLGRALDPFDRSVDMHISKLRRKLGPRVHGEERIKTVRNVGYIYTLPLER
jgi:two-component system response regulator CpxR